MFAIDNKKLFYFQHFAVRSVKNIIPARHFSAKILNKLPVVMDVEFVAVTPETEIYRFVAVICEKFIRKLIELFVSVMAGRPESEQIALRCKTMQVIAGTAEFYPALPCRFHDKVAVFAVRVCHALYFAVEKLFKGIFIVHYLMAQFIFGHIDDMGMSNAVNGYFMAFIRFHRLIRQKSADEQPLVGCP